MRLSLTAVLLSVLAASADDQHIGNKNLRTRKETEGQDTMSAIVAARNLEKDKRRALLSPCVTHLVHVLLKDTRDDQHIECELQGEDLANGRSSMSVLVKGLDADFAHLNNLVSSVSTIYVDGAEIDDAKYELVIPTELKDRVEVGRRSTSFGSETDSGDDEVDATRHLMRSVAPTGTKTILALRVESPDGSTTLNERQISNSIFGTYGDRITPKSQFNACSNGQLILQPVTTNAKIGRDSVLTVKLPEIVPTFQGTHARVSVLAQAQRDLGVRDLNEIADFIVVVLPPRASETRYWANAYDNVSTYNDTWVDSLTTIMHEFGHNLNLHHGDQSGYMGFVTSASDGPLMCFNGPKTYQLGWFPKYHVNLGGSNHPFSWRGDLVGFAQVNRASGKDKMVIRIQAPVSDTDFYVHFNRGVGNNVGTRLGKNQVLVTSRASGTGWGESRLLTKMNSGATYYVNNFNGSGRNLKITVHSINTSTTPSRARLSVSLGNPPTSSPTNPPTQTSCIKFSTNTNYRITARHSGMALSVRGASKSQSAAIVQNAVSNQDASQLWNLQPAKVRTEGYYKLQNYNSDLMLGASSNRDGTLLFQYQNNNAFKSQEWCFKSAGNGFYYIEAGHINKVFEVQSGSRSANTNVRIFRNAGVAHEQWRITPATISQPTPPPTIRQTPRPTSRPTPKPPAPKPKSSCVSFSTNKKYRITSRRSGLALSVRGASKSNSAVIVQNTVSSRDTSQRWNLLPAQVRNGHYKLQNDNSNLMIGASGNTNGSVLKQYQNRNWKSQEWCFKSAGNGFYYIEAGHIDKVFYVKNGSRSADADIRLYPQWNDVLQEQWKITAF